MIFHLSHSSGIPVYLQLMEQIRHGVVWFIVRPLGENAQDALGYFAVVVSASLAIYAISACLSTFCDDGWRFRLTALCHGGALQFLR